MMVSNWDRWQSYRTDRGTPPWIKVYRNLMSNQEWAQLSDAEKGQIVSIWILAADKGGIIPDDATIIQKMCMLDTPPNLKKFKDLGFLLSNGCQDDAKATPERRQNDAPETETLQRQKYNACSSDDERDFEEFWKRYPRKQDKKKARTAFLRLSKKKRELATKDCAARYEGTERRFIPIPTTYIHGERWDDEIESKPDNLSDYAKGGI